MLSTLSVLLRLLLTEADVQLSLFKAGAVWLLMLKAPSSSFALLPSYPPRPLRVLLLCPQNPLMDN